MSEKKRPEFSLEATLSIPITANQYLSGLLTLSLVIMVRVHSWQSQLMMNETLSLL